MNNDIVKVESVIKPFGRPSKLTSEIIAEAWEYLNSVSDMTEGELPTIEGLALSIGISRETIYSWSKDDVSKDFSDIVKQLQAMQAQKLLQLALVGKYNPMIAKLILSGKHGYVEKTEVDNKHEMVTPILGGESKKLAEDFTEFTKRETDESL